MVHKSIIDALNHDLANLHVFWVKLHNYHWNIRGLQFFTLHAKTEEYYDYIGGFYDDVAERILQLGARPLASLAKYLQTTSLAEEDSRAFSAEELLQGVKAGFEVLLTDAKSIHGLADKNGDIGTATLYEDHIAKLGAIIWMLESAAS